MAKSKSKRTKSLGEALDQRNRILNELVRRGQSGRWKQSDFMGVGTVIGNMADRLTMRGLDYMDANAMDKVRFGYNARTTMPTDEQYNAAVAKAEARAQARGKAATIG